MALTQEQIVNQIVNGNKLNKLNLGTDFANQFGRYEDHSNRAAQVSLEGDRFKTVEKLADEILEKKDDLKDATRKYSKKALQDRIRNKERLLKKDARVVAREFADAEKYHERALQVLGTEKELGKPVERLLKGVERDTQNQVKEIERWMSDAFKEGTEKLEKGISVAGVTFDQGMDEKGARKIVERIEQNLENARESIERFVADKVDHHLDELSKIRDLRGQIEEAANIKFSDYLGKTGSVVEHTAEKELGSALKTAAHEEKTMMQKGGVGGLLGGIVGAVLGYNMSGEDNKTTGTAVGVVAGGAAGYAIQSAMGAAHRGNAIAHELLPVVSKGLHGAHLA